MIGVIPRDRSLPGLRYLGIILIYQPSKQDDEIYIPTYFYWLSNSNDFSIFQQVLKPLFQQYEGQWTFQLLDILNNVSFYFQLM